MKDRSEKHANIPVFIPHLGCPHRCAFCDQNAVTGAEAPDPAKIGDYIGRAVATLGGRKAEIAFFGGSFTAIDRGLMTALLESAQPYIRSGAVCGVRISTRPDAISEEILDLLEAYGVTAIELGVQSMDDGVLRASARGHSAADAEKALAAVAARKSFSLAGQMMLGLPCSDLKRELYTARRICELGADSARVYPTVVLAGTALERMTRQGSYTPLSLEEGVRRGAEVVKVFEAHGVRLLRLGLCEEEGCSQKTVAGCAHPAYGELVKSRLFLEELNSYFENKPRGSTCGKTYTVFTAGGALSGAVGYKGENRTILTERYRCKLIFAESDRLFGRQFLIEEGQDIAPQIS